MKIENSLYKVSGMNARNLKTNSNLQKEISPVSQNIPVDNVFFETTTADEKREDFNKILEELKMVEKELKESQEKNQQEKDALETHMKCLKIALRIMTGNKVPLKDHRFLSKNDPALYGKSILMRIPKEKPIKYKAVTNKKDHEKNISNNNYLEKTSSSNSSLIEKMALETGTALLDIKV